MPFWAFKIENFIFLVSSRSYAPVSYTHLSGAEISLDKSAGTLTVTAPAEFVASQVIDVIGSKLIKRGIDLTAVKWGDSTPSSGGGVRRCATVVNGIDKETAGKINKDIKADVYKRQQ